MSRFTGLLKRVNASENSANSAVHSAAALNVQAPPFGRASTSLASQFLAAAQDDAPHAPPDDSVSSAHRNGEILPHAQSDGVQSPPRPSMQDSTENQAAAGAFVGVDGPRITSFDSLFAKLRAQKDGVEAHGNSTWSAESNRVQPTSGASARGGFAAKLANMWKAKGEAHRRGDFFLKMNPPTDGSAPKHGPVGIPVREILQQIYHHKRSTTVTDCWIYFLYTAVFVSVVYQINNTQDSFTTSEAIKELILFNEFDTRGTVSFLGERAEVSSGGSGYVASDAGSKWNNYMRSLPNASDDLLNNSDPVVVMDDPIDALLARSNGHFKGTSARPEYSLRIDPHLTSINLSDVTLSGDINGTTLKGRMSGSAPGVATAQSARREPVEIGQASASGPAVTAQITMSNSFTKTFFDIQQFGELQDWLTGPFIDGMYPDAWYNGDPLEGSESQRVANGMLRLTHGVRLWQVRVSGSTCNLLQSLGSEYNKRFKDQGSSACYGPLLPGKNEATTPFGPPWSPGKYKFSPSVGAPLEGLDGWGQSQYGSGGYVAFLGLNGTEARNILADLLTDRWLDRSTRALGVDFNLFNSETNLLSVVRLLVEVLPTGFMLTSYRIYTFKLVLYGTQADIIRAAGECLVMLGCLYYLAVEIRQCTRSKPMYRYFSDPANAFDLILQALMIACLSYWSFFVTNRLVSSLDLNEECVPTQLLPNSAGAKTCYIDLFDFARSFNYSMTFAGFLGFLMSMKFFKYFSISRRMNSLWLTLYRASESLVAFTLGFSLLVAGFAFMGQMCFGNSVSEFHSWESAFATLLRYPLGDFSYKVLSQARPDAAPIFFTLYMALIFLVCMNMVVAIITIAFEEVHIRLQVEEKWKHAGRTLEQFYLYRVQVYRNAALRFLTKGMHGGDGRDWRTMEAEDHYYDLMGKFIDDAELHSRVDLLRYMEDVYKACPPGSNLYMGINELCSLARNPDSPAAPFCTNGHREANARGGALSTKVVPVQEQHGCRAALSCLCTCGRPALAGPVKGPISGFTGLKGSIHSNPLMAARTMNVSWRGVAQSRISGDSSMTVPELHYLHGHRCSAWQMVHAYYAYKDVVCMGPTNRHQFWGDSVRAKEGGGGDRDIGNVRASWKVTKVNRSNVAQLRIISIEQEKERYVITTRDMHMRLKKRVPVNQVVQLESDLTDARRCLMYLEAEVGSGAGGWDSYLAVQQDTTFDLIFVSQLDRDAFIEKLEKYREELIRKDRGLLEAALGGTVAADAATKLLSATNALVTPDGRPNTSAGATLAHFQHRRLSIAGQYGGNNLESTTAAIHAVSSRWSNTLSQAQEASVYSAKQAAGIVYRSASVDHSLVSMDIDEGRSSPISSSSLNTSAPTSTRNLFGLMGAGSSPHVPSPLGASGRVVAAAGSLGASASVFENPLVAAHLTTGNGEDFNVHTDDDDEDVDHPHGGRVQHTRASSRSAMRTIMRRTGTMAVVEMHKSSPSQRIYAPDLTAEGYGSGPMTSGGSTPGMLKKQLSVRFS